MTGPEKKREKAIDLAYTTLMHVQLCSHAHLIMWLAHCILCKQQLILQLAYMYSVAVLIIPMQLARSYSQWRSYTRATLSSARATELVLEHVANSVSIFLLVFIAKCLFRAVCLPSAAVKIRLLT